MRSAGDVVEEVLDAVHDGSGDLSPELVITEARLDVVRRLRERLKREHANGCNVDDCLCCRGAMFVADQLEAEIRGKAGG